MALLHKFKQDGENYIIDINSGSIHLVDDLVYNLLEENELPALEVLIERFERDYNKNDIVEAYEELQSLIEEEVLYSKDYFEDRITKDKSKSFIKALCLNVVHDCNFKCKYCFADEGEYKGKRQIMSVEVGKKAIDFVIEHSGPRRNIEVDLFGGEPLLAFDKIVEIIAYAREVEKKHNKNIRFTMTTNAMLLDDETFKYVDKELGNLVLSIDGRKEVNDKVRVNYGNSGTYDAILPKIKAAVQKRDPKKQYYVRGTFTRNNLDFYEDVMHLAELGFKEISVEPVVLPKEHELSLKEEDLPIIFDQYDKLYAEMLKRAKGNDAFSFYHFNIDVNGGPCIYKRISGCGAGHEYAAITPEGDIYPCHQFVGNEKFKMGNIFNGEMRNDIGEEFKEATIYQKPKCRKCWARFYCSGGCQANNYNFNGDIHEPYELGCELQKKRIECAIALKTRLSQV